MQSSTLTAIHKMKELPQPKTGRIKDWWFARPRSSALAGVGSRKKRVR
jgi:hypothetical protein